MPKYTRVSPGMYRGPNGHLIRSPQMPTQRPQPGRQAVGRATTPPGAQPPMGQPMGPPPPQQQPMPQQPPPQAMQPPPMQDWRGNQESHPQGINGVPWAQAPSMPQKMMPPGWGQPPQMGPYGPGQMNPMQQGEWGQQQSQQSLPMGFNQMSPQMQQWQQMPLEQQIKMGRQQYPGMQTKPVGLMSPPPEVQ